MKQPIKTLITLLIVHFSVHAKTSIERFAKWYPKSNCKSVPQGKQKFNCILEVYNKSKSTTTKMTEEEKLTDELIEIIKKSTNQQKTTAKKCWLSKNCKQEGQIRCNVECLQCRKDCF